MEKSYLLYDWNEAAFEKRVLAAEGHPFGGDRQSNLIAARVSKLGIVAQNRTWSKHTYEKQIFEQTDSDRRDATGN